MNWDRIQWWWLNVRIGPWGAPAGTTLKAVDVADQEAEAVTKPVSQFGATVQGLQVARCGRCNGAGARRLEGENRCPACKGAGWLDLRGRPSYENPPDTGAPQ